MGEKDLRPNFLLVRFQTRGPELQARFDPVISVSRFWILPLEGIRSVIHLVLALKNAGLLRRSAVERYCRAWQRLPGGAAGMSAR